MKTRIIGFTGKKGHGKDTAASALHGELRARRQPVGNSAFAFLVKKVTQNVFGIDPFCRKEQVIPVLGLSPRQIWQLVGTEVGRQGRFGVFAAHFGPDTAGRINAALLHSFVVHDLLPGLSCWVDGWAKHIDPEVRVELVTDVRFPNEAAKIHELGGVVVKVVRPSADTGHSEGHASETSVDLIDPDYTLDNSGSVVDLRNRVRNLLGELP